MFLSKKQVSFDRVVWREYFLHLFKIVGKSKTTSAMFSALEKYPNEIDFIHDGYFSAHLEIILESVDDCIEELENANH